MDSFCSTFESFEPTHPELARVWQALGEPARRQRYTDARQRYAVVKLMVASMKSGKAERHALREVAPGTPRSTWRRWKRRYDEHGIDGLFDWRRPARSPVPDAVKEAIYTLRRADPSKQVEDIVAHVKEHHGCGISKTTVRRILHKAGLARRRGAPARSKQCGEQRLELGGMKLVEAAAEATGYVDALVDGVVEQLDEAVRQALAVSHVRLVKPHGKAASRRVRTVGVLAGSGGGELGRMPPGLDVVVTGDVKYHDALTARARGLAVIDAGHAGMEKWVVPLLTAYLRGKFSHLRVSAYTEPDLFRLIPG